MTAIPDTDKYIVIEVSSPKENYETPLLKRCKITGQEWLFCATDGKSFYNNMQDLQQKFSFLLLNASRFKLNESMTKVEKLYEVVKQSEKSVIIWAHTGDEGSDTEENRFGEDDFDDISKRIIRYESFSHVETRPIVSFLKVIGKEGCSEDTYKAAFESLVKASLKKKGESHLLALEILCLGYIAAHDLEKLSMINEDWRKLVLHKNFRKRLNDNKYVTNDPAWWSVINKKEIEEELMTVGKKVDSEEFKLIYNFVDMEGKTPEIAVSVVNLMKDLC